MQQYKHRSLDTRSKQIRLLRIEKEMHDQQIVSSLRHALLDDGEAFNALSYAWGEKDAMHDIVIRDGDKTGSFSVRPNLYDFLTTAHNSQDDWATEWIWIDQICIDQNHHEEKCHQIAQMAKIYSSAMATIIWPGLTHSLERHDQPYGNPSTLILDNNELEIISSIVQPVSSNDSPRILSTASIDLLTMVPETMLHDVVRSPYWSRLWVIQEVALASQVQIVIAGRTWDLDDFHMALCSWVENKDRIKSFIAARNGLNNLILGSLLFRLKAIDLTRLTVRTGHGHLSWGFAFPLVLGSSCTLPFDRVYAVMALVHEDLRLYPDYTISPSQLLQKILQKQLAFPTHFLTLDHLFDMIEQWTTFLKFEPLESVREMLPLVSRGEDMDPSAEVKIGVIWLVLKELDIPWPTLILDTEQGFCWTVALKFLHIIYAHGPKTELEIAYVVSAFVDAPGLKNVRDDIVRSISLQQCFIEAAPVHDDEGTADGRLSNTMCRRKSFTTIAAHNEGEQTKKHEVRPRRKSVPDIVCGLAGPGDSSSHLPRRLIDLFLVDLKHVNVVGNYNTGIPWDSKFEQFASPRASDSAD